MIQITPENLVAARLCDPKVANDAAPALQAACLMFGIDTGLRVAGFLAQCAHESNKFTATSENLNYGPHGLIVTFPKYFSTANANDYARNPQKIANRVYGGRMGNGPEASGEGWKFRGRGYIQLTGKNNYSAYDAAMAANGSIIASPDVVAMPQHAAMSAAWFWSTHGLNAIADKKDMLAMTKVINGGALGIQERTKYYNQALLVFK